MKHLLYTFFLGTSILVFSCKNETSTKQPEVKTPPTETGTIDEGVVEDVSFKTKSTKIAFENYIALKNALVNTDAAQTKEKAKIFMKNIKNVKEINPKINKILKEILEAETIDKQRQSFGDLTSFMENMIAGDIIEGAVFKQFCPMAFKNRGAYWLSNSKEIRNPYFGDKMLKCGRVAEEIN